MTLIKPYSASFYVGDNETKEFPFTFDEVSESFVKVLVSHADGSVSIPTYTVDLQLKQVVFGDETPAPTDDDVVCIYRATPVIQDTPFRTLQGYNAQALENILSKIVAMIQEIKSTYFSTQVLQGDPWQLDLLKSEDNGATVNIDYVAKKLVKGLYFQIKDGNLQVSADGNSYITMPKSVDVAEFRQREVTLPDLTVVYKLEYRVGNIWYDAGGTAESKADEAIEIAEEARDIANEAKGIAENAKETAEGIEDIAQEAKDTADEAKEIAQDAKDIAEGVVEDIEAVEEGLENHIANKSNPHEVTKAQVGLGNVDNTSDLNKPISTATQTALNGKQATISDLATIRSNAQAGKAASNTIATYGNIVTHNVSEFATAAQGAKADTAIQPSDLGNGTITITQGGITKGTFTTNQGSDATIALDAGGGGGAVDSVNGKTGVVVLTATDVGALPDSTVIPTVNNPTITITQGGVTKGSFTLNQATGDTIALDAGGGGIGNIDNLTITANADDEIQTVATINANTATGATNPIYDWVGTLTEYNAQNIETLHPDWVCFITDDLSAEAYEAYTKGETLNMFVQKGHQVVEFQEPTAANNYTWYRKYADGWVEQGGAFATVNDAYHNETVTLLIEMNSVGYSINVSSASNGSAYTPVISTKSTTGFTIERLVNIAAYSATWQVSGMAA